MTVENMVLMNVIGNIREVDNILKDIVSLGGMDMVSAMSQIEDNSFLFNVGDKNLEKLIDLNNITSFKNDNQIQLLSEKLNELKALLDISGDYKIDNSIMSDNELLDSCILDQEVNGIYKMVEDLNSGIANAKKELEKIESFYSNFQYTSGLSVPIEKLRDLEYFDFKFGVLSKENRRKFKNNYENILAVIFHTGTKSNNDTFLIVYPKSVSEEMERILRSLQFCEIVIPSKYTGTFTEIKGDMEVEKFKIKQRIYDCEKKLINIKNEYGNRILFLLEQLNMDLILNNIKGKLAKSDRFFYLSGWVSEKNKSEIESILKKYDDALILYKSDKELIPPTKLNNNWIFKPFEEMVKMYGIPSYNEIDPTPFLSLSYMLLFGIMFGDLGQGFVLLLGGMLISRKNKIYGGLLSRLGFGSMVFGALYGSVFGFEDLFPALLIKPFENINTILLSAVIIGTILILTSYVYGMVNSIKRKDLEEGLFGKEGLIGLIFYLCLLSLIGGNLLNMVIIPKAMSAIVIILCLIGLVFKRPLTQLLLGKRPLHDKDIGGYYIESIFSLLEVILSMLSGTISFIRVGAFALTHVGLFIAFQTIGKMIGNPAANLIVLLIGNVIIIGLEGLIVLIQGLRLQYYELFSRYYKGEGKEFNPISLKN